MTLWRPPKIGVEDGFRSAAGFRTSPTVLFKHLSLLI